MGAELQQITYREYLPNVLGSEAFGDLGDRDTTYNPHVDPSILNEFATVAFRSDSHKNLYNFVSSGLDIPQLQIRSMVLTHGLSQNISLSEFDIDYWLKYISIKVATALATLIEASSLVIAGSTR